MSSNRLFARLYRRKANITRLAFNHSNKSMSGRSSDAPANDTPAAAAFTSTEQVKQEQDVRAGQQQQPSQQQQQVPPAVPTGTLQDMDTNDLVAKRNQILWDQAVKGQQPGLSLMQDKLGDNVQETWGNEPTIMDPDRQN